MNKSFLFVGFSVGFLAACSPYYANDSRVESENLFQHYQCRSGEHFDVAYIEQQSAVLRIADREYTLIQIPAASGAKYVIDDSEQTQPQTVLLHTKGDEALLEVGSTTYQGCTTQ
ncbi:MULTISPECIES: MliC family protein [unclassified Vibrio]|uniref:MliC family protein n=1 Tax=unclassified Vibrio TaxID=2614977 RepID=UPI000B8EBD89|nr:MULTISPECIES: MliC family protein [unclassified Vibrio]NAX18212.1 hypothetical protein [Vibrio sp. V22_P2S10T140]OXX45776.1 hypothetical protein B9J83_06440 [Vibrio sp. V07_P2A8T137]OXX56227.1 hypothetical protein B9J82_11190 [Vibrio sp. V10_P2A27P122]PSD40904.1 hypothetical protein C7E22_13625 [Vibrio sp. V02_P2A34T13]